MSIEELQKLPGVGPATAETLIAAGYRVPESLAAVSVEELAAVKGFAEARASAVIEAARVAVSDAQPVDATNPGEVHVSSKVDDSRTEPKVTSKDIKRLRLRHADLKKRAKKARKKSKSASSKKKRKRWAARADKLAKKAKKAKSRLKALD